MRQISASKRSQNVVEIAIIDYCDFEAGILFHSITYLRQYIQLRPWKHR